MKVAVLAGGKGTRLGLPDTPKPMVPVDGRPLLERLLQTAKDAGFTEYVFLNGHLAERIEEHFGDGSRFGVRIMHVREPRPLGTAGAVGHARNELSEPFVLLYGDVLIDVDLAHFAAYHSRQGGIASLFVHPNDHPFDSDVVEADADGRVRRLHPKTHRDRPVPNLVSAALHIFEPSIVDYIPADTSSDWLLHVLPNVLAAGERVYAYRSFEYAKDLGTPDRLRAGEADLRSGRTARLSRRAPKPALFLDRDGVINHEIGGVSAPADLALIDGVAQAIKAANRAGVPAICVTNQPGLAKGWFTEDDLQQVFTELDRQLALHGAYLDAVYYCPHHPERGWPGEVEALKVPCACRKPMPGLLTRAADEHNLDLSRSWVIGDRWSDIAAAHAAGARAALVESEHGTLPPRCVPDFVATSVVRAIVHALEAIR